MALPSQPLGLTAHDVLVFDVYGTLVDWESAIHDALAPVLPNQTREEILLAYAHVEGTLQSQFPDMPYTTLLEHAYRQLARAARGDQPDDDDVARRFGQSIPAWQPFPDTLHALHRLKKHFALVVLSNVDDASFAGTHARALSSPDYPTSAYRTVAPDSPFVLVLTAQRVGAYKPSPAMLTCALQQLSSHPDPALPIPSDPALLQRAADAADVVASRRVLVVANSVRHDIIPAMRHGLHSVWIRRHGVSVIGNEHERSAAHDGGHPCTWQYETLGELADAVEAEAQLQQWDGPANDRRSNVRYVPP